MAGGLQLQTELRGAVGSRSLAGAREGSGLQSDRIVPSRAGMAQCPVHSLVRFTGSAMGTFQVTGRLVAAFLSYLPKVSSTLASFSTWPVRKGAAWRRVFPARVLRCGSRGRAWRSPAVVKVKRPCRLWRSCRSSMGRPHSKAPFWGFPNEVPQVLESGLLRRYRCASSESSRKPGASEANLSLLVSAISNSRSSGRLRRR